MSKKKYVILGGNGVFGVHCALYLLDKADPESVICIGRNPEKPEPYSLNIGKGDPRYAYHQVHLTWELERFFEILDRERPEVIINFAALSEVASSWDQPWSYYETNIVALSKICHELMQRDYLERFVHIGSSELYGAVNEPATEDHPVKPSSPYACSKAVGDMHLNSLWDVMKFPMNILLPSNCYAPGQMLYRIVPRTVLCGLVGEKLPLQGGGRARKSYMHARDLARGIHMVIENAPLGRTYNLGPAKPISIRDLVGKVLSMMSVPFDDVVEVVADRPGQDAQYWLDSTRIKNELGWEPEISMEQGLQEMIDWGRTYIDDLVKMPVGFEFQA